jgi:dTMP kinase
MAAARAHHVATVIRPALEGGRDVVCDRFAGSSIAYQGYGRGLAPDEVASVSAWAAAGLEPDTVILLEVDPEVAAARRSSDPGARSDRIEDESAAFHARVAQGFRALAAARPRVWRVVDGSGTPDEVAAAIRRALHS